MGSASFRWIMSIIASCLVAGVIGLWKLSFQVGINTEILEEFRAEVRADMESFEDRVLFLERNQRHD